MKRNIENDLINWKMKEIRYPLLVRGARQVGKSYIIEDFGKKYFDNIVVVNFEFDPALKSCFISLNPQEIINKLQLLQQQKIVQGKTLLFLDEIQECPEAIISLRYFKEKMPNLAVIGAGSLLEFAINKKDFRMPVGRIQFLNLEPCSFYEFIESCGYNQLNEHLSAFHLNDKTDDVIHEKLLELLQKYFIIGGMPAVIKEYIHSEDMLECQHLQASILETYRGDFGKYANIAHHKYLQKVFEAVPRLVGQRIKYVAIDKDTKSRDLKNALELLTMSRVVRTIYSTKASGLPLGAQIDEKKFKVNFLDVGLMQNACGIQAEIQKNKNLLQINAGSVAEQFVGQELRAYADRYRQNDLYFWARDKRGSSSEVDYIISIDDNIIPIEVKSGKTGKLKSLNIFLKEKNVNLGIKISSGKFFYKDNILSLPLYMIKEIPRLVREINIHQL